MIIKILLAIIIIKKLRYTNIKQDDKCNNHDANNNDNIYSNNNISNLNKVMVAITL